jgi:hypothetical protein
VWGPAGDRGSMEWYPGGDVVDFISIAIYGLPDKNITDPTRQESFETIFNRKAWRMRFASKPIFVTEFGVKGPEDFQAQWLEKAAEVLAVHGKLLEYVISISLITRRFGAIYLLRTGESANLLSTALRAHWNPGVNGLGAFVPVPAAYSVVIRRFRLLFRLGARTGTTDTGPDVSE